MDTKRVGNITQATIDLGLTRAEQTSEQRELLNAPAEPLAQPMETAKAASNAVDMMTAVLMPSANGIYAIGAVAVKLGNIVKAVGSVRNWGSWGFWMLAIAAVGLGASNSGCLPPNAVDNTNATVANTSVDVSSATSAVCNPFNDPDYPVASGDHGVVASLKYLDSGQTRFQSAADYQKEGHSVNTQIFMSEINVPSRLFSLGFTDQDGHNFKNDIGHRIYEYFGLHFDSDLEVQDVAQSGQYQLGLLANEGAVLKVDNGNGMQTLIDNDGRHPTKFGCARQPITMQVGQPVPISLDYYQGYRYHMAVVLLWRPWPNHGDNWNHDGWDHHGEHEGWEDAECGQYGNTHFFGQDIRGHHEKEQAFKNMEARGWKVIPPADYTLPPNVASNPCQSGSNGGTTSGGSTGGTTSGGTTGGTTSGGSTGGTTAPLTTTITNAIPSEADTNSTSIMFTYQSSDSSAIFQCSLDSAAFTSCPATGISYSALADGSHTFAVESVVGTNIDTTGATYNWTIDTTPPVISNIVTTTTSTSFTITWDTNEPATTYMDWGLGAATTANQTTVDTTLSTTHSVTVTGLTPSTVYSYYPEGADAAGNVIPPVRQAVMTTP